MKQIVSLAGSRPQLVKEAVARAELDWRPVWTLEKAVMYTATWYHAFMQRGEIRTDEQLDRYIQDAVAEGTAWTKN